MVLATDVPRITVTSAGRGARFTGVVLLTTRFFGAAGGGGSGSISIGLRNVNWMLPSVLAWKRTSACFGFISSVTARTMTGSLFSADAV